MLELNVVGVLGRETYLDGFAMTKIFTLYTTSVMCILLLKNCNFVYYLVIYYLMSIFKSHALNEWLYVLNYYSFKLPSSLTFILLKPSISVFPFFHSSCYRACNG